MRLILVTFVSAGLLAGGVCPVAANDDPGAQLAATCAACHRPDGGDTGIPSIVGLDAERLGQMLQSFKSGGRASHLMLAVSRSLSDQEIVAVARYLAAQATGVKQP